MLRITKEDDRSFFRAYENIPPNPLANFVTGKRVAIIGGSPKLLGTGDGENIDSYDTVIRINCHWPYPQRVTPQIESQVDLGNRTDLLFHNGSTGGSVEDVARLEGLRGIIFLGRGMRGWFCQRKWNQQYLHVHPTLTYWAYQNEVPFYEFNWYWHSLRNYEERKFLTAGTLAALALINEAPKELYFTGFTFYEEVLEKKFLSNTMHKMRNDRYFFKKYIMIDERVTLSEHTRRSLENRNTR